METENSPTPDGNAPFPETAVPMETPPTETDLPPAMEIPTGAIEATPAPEPAPETAPEPAPKRKGGLPNHKPTCKCMICERVRKAGAGKPRKAKAAPAAEPDLLGEMPGELPPTTSEGPAPDFSDLSSAAPPPPPDYGLMAGMTFDMGTSTLSLVFGPEWQPQNAEERGAVVGALTKYFEAKQVKDLPPGMLLAVVLTAYAAPRLRAPATASKLQLAWAWFKSKVAWRFSRRPALSIVPHVPSVPTTGTNGA